MQSVAFTLSIELALASDIVVAAEDVRFRQLGSATPCAGAGAGSAWASAPRYP
jgi:enoyl-CoA hydratase/carnithine racemase